MLQSSRQEKRRKFRIGGTWQRKSAYALASLCVSIKASYSLIQDTKRGFNLPPESLKGARFLRGSIMWTRFRVVAEEREGRESYAFGKFAIPVGFDESLMLGAFMLMTGADNGDCSKRDHPKMTDIHLGFSRDGFHFSRAENRSPFIAASRKAGTWDRGYLHSNAALCLVDGEFRPGRGTFHLAFVAGLTH